MTKVFLSYSHANEVQARRLYDELRGHGLDVWFDRESLLPGQTWEDVIEDEIQKTDYVILLLSKSSIIRRGFFQKEIRLAMDVLDTIPIGHVYLLPVRLDDCEIPGRLSAIQYLDLFPQWDRSLEKLYKAIDHQDGVRSRAAAAEVQQKEGKAVRLLLVNDQPSTMNFVVDLWKGSGITVEYAFDVPQAIHAIEQSPYDVIVSDLTHMSPVGQVTDQAAFEILEWARGTGTNIKVIISTSKVTSKRQKIALELGAVGICNNLQELNRLIETATGLHIDYSPKLSAGDVLELAQPGQQGRASKEIARRNGSAPRLKVYISFSRKDIELVRKLAGDLERHGVIVLADTEATLLGGQDWANPLREMIRTANRMLAILSPNLLASRYVLQEIYEGLARERDMNQIFVIPLLIKTVEIPHFIANRQTINLGNDYDKGLNQLLEVLGV